MLLEVEPLSARGNPFGEREFVITEQVARFYRFPDGEWGVWLRDEQPGTVHRVAPESARKLEAMIGAA